MPNKTIPKITYRYYPTLSSILTKDDIPEILGFLREGIQNLLSKIHYKDLQYNKNSSGDSTFYSLKIISPKRLGISIPGTDINLLLNPNLEENYSSDFPITVEYQWKILAYLRAFRVSNFSFTPQEIFEIALRVLNITEEQAVTNFISTFTTPTEEKRTFLEQFVLDVNSKTDLKLTAPDETTTLSQIIQEILQKNDNEYVSNIIYAVYILNSDVKETMDKIKIFFKNFIPDNIDDYIKDILIPKFRATLLLSAGLEFPRNILIPVYPKDSPKEYEPIEDSNQKVILTFAEALFYADTQQGLGYDMELVLNTNIPAQIGKTGLIIDINNLKIDLSTKTNFAEADLDGRPPEFIGVYTQQTDIILPKKWFTKNPNNQTQTLKIVGRKLLIGTGGISGSIALEAVEFGNPIGEDDYLEVRLGKNIEKSWLLGFNKFDIRFNQGVIVESNIKAQLTIPTFRGKNGEELKIGVEGHLYEDGDFSLTASFIDGIKANLFNFVEFNFLTLELGKNDSDFFIGTSCEISFQNEIMKKILGDQKILIPRVRIYTNGRFELVGGNSFIPTNVKLNLGPINVAVTGVHYGSHEEDGVLYNYWGFDGAISLNPLGIDARGEGIKYYYPVDNRNAKSFIRIQTIEVDLVIPGSASPSSALAIIHGILSIPEPGESPEYYGEINLELPQIKVSGGAAMKLQPKSPAFIIDANINLPAPIPIGPVGIYGFRGLLGFRYVAEKEAIGLKSGQDTWYDYYVYPPKGIHVTKFSGPERTKDYDAPFSLGVGATLGTSFDSGTLISLRAMLLFSLPTAFMIDAGLTILSKRLGLIEDDPRNPPFFAFIAIGDDSMEFGFGADFQLPDNGSILDLQAKVEAGFFFKNQRPWYVNFGTRENPVKATLFKDILNISTWSYLMLSAQGIEAGSRAQLIFDKKFGPVRLHLSAYIEVGGYISFKKRQMGGYMMAGGAAKIDVWKIVGFSISADILFSIEAIKPFLIYASLKVKVCAKIVFVKVCIKVNIEIKWEKSNSIDKTPIAPIPFDNSDSDQTDRTLELVKGVHMLTNDTFELDYFKTEPNPLNILKMIPLDTYIDIKTVKGLDPSEVSISGKLGGHTGGAENFQDLIPPKKNIKGKELRQVTHRYSMKNFDVKIYNQKSWVDYNPFEAIVENESVDTSNLRIGFWQRTGKQYDNIRILATSPFAYTTAGQPGWFTPEQYGITASELFCVEENLKKDCSNFNHLEYGKRYYTPIGYDNHFINGAYYSLETDEALVLDTDTGTYYNEQEEYMEIDKAPNPFSTYRKSLTFKNENKLVITLPEPSVNVNLKLTTKAKYVKIYFYTSYGVKVPILESVHPQYRLIGQPIRYTKKELEKEVEFESKELPITRIVIEPSTFNKVSISETLEKLTQLQHDSSLNLVEDSVVTSQMNLLTFQLESLKASVCTGELYISENDSRVLCQLYEKFLDYYWNCLKVPFTLLDREPAEAPYIRQAQFIIDNLPCYKETLTFLNTTLNQLDIYYYFEENIKSYSIIRIELITICNEAMKDGEISYPKEVEMILSKHQELISAYEIILNKVRSFRSNCGTRLFLCDEINSTESALKSCLSGLNTHLNDYISCYKKFRDNIEGILKMTVFGYPNLNSKIFKFLFNQQDEYFMYYYMGLEINLQRLLRENSQEILNLFRDYINCNNSGSNPQNPDLTCTTSLQEVCWLTLEKNIYNETIPGSEAIEADQQDMEAGINKIVQPIWRPNSTYYIRFVLVDNVNNGENLKEFVYYYGFKTSGAIGHYTGQNSDNLALSSLRNYIDYNRSYPNVDSNLLKSKPIFFGHDECKIALFFTHPYVYHMFTNWKVYKELTGIKAGLRIVIKDPVTNEVIPYPLPIDYIPTGPITEGNENGDAWINDQDPRLPLHVQTYINYVKNINANNGAIKCELKLGNLLKPLAYSYTVNVTNLKPQKLYTVQVYSNYENATKLVHEFVFQTSRYISFEEQINSYWITLQDDTTQHTKAIYSLQLTLSNNQLEEAYKTLLKSMNQTSLEDTNPSHQDYFDKVIEKVFKMSPMAPVQTTEFNRIINTSNGKLVAVLIRTSEPFNDPKIPIEEIRNMISIENTTDYSIVYSKDYTQALIMTSTKEFNMKTLNFKFRNFTWNGSSYEIVKEIAVNNITINA